MATIVKRRKDGKTYVLLGSGFGAFQSKKPNWFLGDWVGDVEEGQFAMVCVCDTAGTIGWLRSTDVLVESIDGETVSTVFGA